MVNPATVHEGAVARSNERCLEATLDGELHTSLVPELRPNSRYWAPCLAKLNRLPWSHGFAFQAYGVRIGIRGNSAHAVAQVAPFLPAKRESANGPYVDLLFSLIEGGVANGVNVKRYHLVYMLHERLTRTMEAAEATRAFDRALHGAIAEHAKRRVFVHAGVVGWQGRAALIVGRSLAGKSTLVESLLRAGATYFSDEYAVLDGRGRVHPYPKPLSIRGDAQTPARLTTAEELGADPAQRPLPVGLVLDTTYLPGVKWRPRRLSSGQGLLALLRNTIPARHRPRSVLKTLHAVLNDASVLRGARGEADAIVPRILDELQHARFEARCA